MAVKEVTKFVASDGTEFVDKDSAETHEATYRIKGELTDLLYNATRLDHEDSEEAASVILTHYLITKK